MSVIAHKSVEIKHTTDSSGSGSRYHVAGHLAQIDEHHPPKRCVATGDYYTAIRRLEWQSDRKSRQHKQQTGWNYAVT